MYYGEEGSRLWLSLAELVHCGNGGILGQMALKA